MHSIFCKNPWEISSIKDFQFLSPRLIQTLIWGAARQAVGGAGKKMNQLLEEELEGGEGSVKKDFEFEHILDGLLDIPLWRTLASDKLSGG